MDFTYDTLGGIPVEDAYARLIEDCMAGESVLFTRSDAVEEGWKLFDPIIKYRESHRCRFTDILQVRGGRLKAINL